jgi:DNA-binding NarL/FixJ family response regulator
MIYTRNYDHAIIEKMEESGIDAYIHKYEPIGEIRKAYSCLAAGEGYISSIFHTLYYEYCLRMDKLPPAK